MCAGASQWFRGGLVSYASQLKFDLLKVTPGPVVSATAAEEMARGARDIARHRRSACGHWSGRDPTSRMVRVPGPFSWDWQLGEIVSHVQLRVPGDRARVRSFSAIGALDALRRGLDRSA